MVWDIITSIVVPIVIAYITSILTSRTDRKKIENLELIVSNSKEQIAKLELMLSKSDVQILELRNSVQLQSQQLEQLKGLSSLQKDSDATNIDMEIKRLNQDLIDTMAEIETEQRLKDISMFPVNSNERRYDENHLRQLIQKRNNIQNNINVLQSKLDDLKKGGLV
ncbi:MAG: hypothetical protein KBT22_09245 [Bacteroidales bacterium]|nr:hypothetical protein [Candidatus Scybalocola fimicaballi]